MEIFLLYVNHDSDLTGALAACPDDSHFFITAPLEIEALSGSCLQIPCNFSGLPRQTFDSRRTTFGVWIKNDHRFKSYPRNVIFNSGQTVNTYPMNITGNLSQKNCTTLFSSLNTTYTDKYYFRIESNEFRSTAVCDPVQITVKGKRVFFFSVILLFRIKRKSVAALV